MANFDALPGQNTRHGVGFAVRILQRLAQVEEPAALGHRRQAAFHSRFYGAAHGGVGCQLGSIQFRVAARQVQAADIGGQCRILQGAEKAQLRAFFLQSFQCFGVSKAERGIPRHSNTHVSQGHVARGRGRRGAIKQGGKARPIDGFLCSIRQNFYFILQVCNLPCGFQPQVAALDGSLRQRRQVTYHRQAGLLF